MNKILYKEKQPQYIGSKQESLNNLEKREAL